MRLPGYRRSDSLSKDLCSPATRRHHVDESGDPSALLTLRVRVRAVGAEVSRALNPAQQVVKIVNEELVATLGEPGRLTL